MVVAITGAGLFLFLIMHMLGNLKSFMGMNAVTGAHKLDEYAHFLRTVGHEFVGNYTVLWATRMGLLVMLVLHVVTVVQLQVRNAQSRPVPYAQAAYDCATFSARSMLFSGIFLLVFVVFHIFHFTTGHLHFQGFIEGKVYANVVSGFGVAIVGVFYIAAMLALAFHLYHGIWSMFQTLGLDNPARNTCLRRMAKAGAALLFLGFISVPVAVMSGVLTLGN